MAKGVGLESKVGKGGPLPHSQIFSKNFSLLPHQNSTYRLLYKNFSFKIFCRESRCMVAMHTAQRDVCSEYQPPMGNYARSGPSKARLKTSVVGSLERQALIEKMRGLLRKGNSMESNWDWSLAHPLHDVEDMVELADSHFGHEADGILKRDRSVFRHRATVATTEQLFNKSREFIAVCRGEPQIVFHGEGMVQPLLGFCWFDRGGYTTYSNEEISNAKFHHLDLSLPVRTRVRLLNQMIDQHILWAHTWGVPVICSTSIRAEHDGFMKIHEKRGFRVNGSYAWIRTEEAMKCLTK